ncbi:MAG: translocation/assembly module TamB domain-containing protein [Kofleriaceae bacterium]
MNARKVARWALRLVLASFALVVLGIGGALIFIHTDVGRDYVRRKAEAALASAFPGGVHVGKIEGSVFTTLVIDDLRLNGRDGKPMVVVGTARVKVSILPLLAHIARIDSIAVEDVTFDKHAQPEPPPELPATPSPGPSAWEVQIARATLVRGRVVVASGSRVIELADLDAQASATIGDGITIQAHATGRYAGKPFEVTTLLGLIDGEIAAPLVVATFDHATLLALGVSTGPRVTGAVRATVPAATVKALAGVELPDDVTLVAMAHDGAIDAKAMIAGASVRALVQADLVAKSATGLVIADIPDATRLDPRIGGSGIVTASLDAALDHVRGIVTVDGMYRVDKATFGQDQIRGTSLLAVDASLAGAWVMFESAVDLGKGRATAIAEVAKQQDEYVLTKSTFLAAASHVGARKTDLAIGSITTSLHASGPLYPKRDLQITGNAGGDALRFGELSVQTVDLALNVRKQATGHLDLGSVRKGDRLLGSASLDAHGTLERSAAGSILTIDVDDHSIATAANGTWSGSGGHIVIDPAKITLANLHTGSGTGKVVADVAYVKATKDLDAKINATQVALATLAPDLQGTVAANVDVHRRGGRWSGGGHVTASKLAIPTRAASAAPGGPEPQVAAVPPVPATPAKPMLIDVDANLQIRGRRVVVDATTTAAAGAVSLAFDVEGPYDLTDVPAWKRLDRRAIDVARIGVSKLDLAKLGKPNLTGVVDGKLGVTANDASGVLHVTGLTTAAGTVDGELTLAPNPTTATDIDAGVVARLDGAQVVQGTATIALPARPFDPAAWKALGKHVLQRADIEGQPIEVEPAMLAKLGISKPYHARVESRLVASEGAETITLTTDVHGLSGGPIKQPIEAHVATTLDAKGVTVAGDIKSAATELVRIDAHAPITLDTLAVARTAKLTGTIELPDTPAKDLVAVFGRADITAGTVGGTIALAGTIGQPTVRVDLSAHGIELPATLQGRKAAKLEELAIKGSWDGAQVVLHVTGNEDHGSLIDLAVEGKPRDRRTLVASLTAVNFDLAPVTALGTGALSAARGTINAGLVLHGFDPDTGEVSGRLQITGGRFPLSPMLGTLRAIDAEIDVANHQVKLTKLDAKLGKGEIHGTGHLDLVGSQPTKMHADLAVSEVSLVRAFQPTIGAVVKIDLAAAGPQWTGTIDVSKGHVDILTSGGAKLLDSELPGDIVFVDEGGGDQVKLGARPAPTKPWLVAAVKIHPVQLQIIQEQFQVRIAASGGLELSLGQGSVGLEGEINATRGDIDLLGGRSYVDHAAVIFDGTIDPRLDVKINRDLDAITVNAVVSGRASKPEINLTSEPPGAYTQGELYAMFIGGQASSTGGSDAAQAGAAAGAGVASAWVSSRIREQLKQHFKIDLDVAFNYEVATATSSNAVRVGFWYSPKLFIAGRGHPEARIDENSNELLFEYHLRGNWIWQGTFGDRNYDGTDFVKRWHW